MITENELRISNKSYTNKDFAVIYKEILDIAKKLSYKYDPEASNESDPFIVLLKLLAFVGDKINYNVDKNILERFMPSATQYNSMQNLTEMMGYNMNYYIAPETTVTMRYVGDAEFSNGKTFKIPKFSTILTDVDGESSFVLIDDSTITHRDATQVVACRVLQGVYKSLQILDKDVITLEDIDINNRVYFPVVKVAQNGVFVTDKTSTDVEEWQCVKNLNTQIVGSKVFKFGYDSVKALPYIEFPKDIGNLIGDGIYINYIETDGVTGNIAANRITKIKSHPPIKWNDSSEEEIIIDVKEGESDILIITNASAAINGANPESIDEAYSNFKRTIGTFDTLVTCRDYANKIYNLKDYQGIYNLVSNVQVADRRTDINYGNNIITFKSSGKSLVNDSPAISANDLCVYPLNPIKTYTIESFKNSFKGISLTDTSIIKYGITETIERELEDSKCVSHNYKTFEDSDIFILKNYYYLQARITTEAKVNAVEAATILTNINTALIYKFNAREVDFGYEIPYDSLLSTIESADSRIKSVSLFEPELTTRVQYTDGREFDLLSEDGQDTFMFIVAKNVLSGKVSLFKYDERFNFAYGQKATKKYNGSNSFSSVDMITENVSSVTTNAGINLSVDSEDMYTLLKNESIQLIAPNLITLITYPYGVNYRLCLSSEDYIKANTEYELKSGEYCIFEYEDSNGNQIVKTYMTTADKPAILKPNFDMYDFETYKENHTPINKEIKNTKTLNNLKNIITDLNSNKLEMFTLSTRDEVEYRTINSETLNPGTHMLYWIMNNTENKINWKNNEYILDEGEYLFRTDLDFKNLYSYGSGTLITKTGLDTGWEAKEVSVDVLEESGLLGHQEYFINKQIDSTNTITITEHQILNLIEGDKIAIYSSDEPTSVATIELSNSFTEIEDKYKISYQFKEDSAPQELPLMQFTGGYWKIRALLNLNCGPDNPQSLYGNQQVTFTYGETNSTFTLKNDESKDVKPIFVFTNLIQRSGGENINLSYYKVTSVNSNSITNENVDLFNETVYCYQLDASSLAVPTSEGRLQLRPNGGNTPKIVVPNTSKEGLVMIYIDTVNAEKTYTLKCNSSGKIKIYNNNESSYREELNLNTGINLITFNGVTELQISTDDEYCTVLVDKFKLLNNYSENDLGLNNNALGLTTLVTKNNLNLVEVQKELLDKISSLDSNKLFYYSTDIDSSKEIELIDDGLASPYAFYDYNNIANKWVISEIDFGKQRSTDNDFVAGKAIDIKIAKSSMSSK